MYCHQGNFKSAHLTKSSFWGENRLAKLSTIDLLQINKDFSAALGDRAYSKLVTLVQGDSHIKKVVGARGSPRLITKFTEDQQQEHDGGERLQADDRIVDEEGSSEGGTRSSLNRLALPPYHCQYYLPSLSPTFYGHQLSRLVCSMES